MSKKFYFKRGRESQGNHRHNQVCIQNSRKKKAEEKLKFNPKNCQ